jgi:NAD(P)H-dependent FMN reductase
MTTPVRVALVIASTREGRYADVVAGFVAPLLAEHHDIELDVVDLADADVPAHFTFQLGEATAAVVARLDQADAFVVVTPEYNHSYPATLKQLIDVSGTVWVRKAVGFVSYGGLSGGLRAVEHLRGVFAERHAATIRETVSFHSFPFDEAGMPDDLTAATTAVKVMADDLVWWAATLRAGRVQG